MTYDWFDRGVFVSAVLLLGAAAFYGAPRKSNGTRTAVTSGAASAPRICADLARARATLEAGKGPKAIERLNTFVSANPDVAEAHLLLARAYAGQQQYPLALKEYRAALVLDPEYADKTSEKFIGHTIKSVMKQGWAPCEITIAPFGVDPAKTTVLDDARYIQRMLAGGCE